MTNALVSLFLDHDRRTSEVVGYEGICVDDQCVVVAIMRTGSPYIPEWQIAWDRAHGYVLISESVPESYRQRLAEFVAHEAHLRGRVSDPCLVATTSMVAAMNGTADEPFMRYWCEILRQYSQWAWRTKHERMAPVDEVYGVVYAYTYLHSWLGFSHGRPPTA